MNPTYLDEYGRRWNGPHPFTMEAIASHAPRNFGVYQVLHGGAGSQTTAYVGVATGETIRGRLRKHCSGAGNWALGGLGNPAAFSFAFFLCDQVTALQIESHVVLTKKPPFNVRPEYRHYIPSIALH
jgi:hypothetical protein